ncbi:MAG: YdbL family protein [Gammaproteobacteria bacterium]|nr:YdbL family protein [Gammaproteobacteria bacterium]
MLNIRSLSIVWLFFFLTSCVTINVYFPAAAAEEAADKIIEQVLGEDAKQGAMLQPRNDSSQQYEINFHPARILAGFLDIMVPSAHAAANIDISSPAINKLESSMQARHGVLSPYFKAGAIGYDANGLVAIRDQSAVGLRERGKLKQLVAQENRDRNALYKELARANGHPEWETQIRDTFARRWVAKAPGGWYYQDSSGNWHQK